MMVVAGRLGRSRMAALSTRQEAREGGMLPASSCFLSCRPQALIDFEQF